MKINSQVKRRQVLIDIPTVGKAKVGACISLQHLDGRHKAPGFSLAMELFVYFPIPSQGEALRNERWSWGCFPICIKDGSAVSAALRAQATGGLFPGPSGSLLCPLCQSPVCEVCACLPAGCWQRRTFFFFLNRAQTLTQSQLSLASCLQNLFYEVNVYAFRLPLGLYNHSAHGCRINLFLQLAKK